MRSTEHEVIVVGGGPTGLTLAGELALAGVDVAVVERRADHRLPESRASGLHARTMEMFDQRGIADRFLRDGQRSTGAVFGTIGVDIGDLPTRHNYLVGLWQNRIESVLADWVTELDVPVHTGCEVAGYSQDEVGVVVELSDGTRSAARYLIGCDGGRSRIRRCAGIDFTGWDPTFSCLVAEAEVDEVPPWATALRRRSGPAEARLVVVEAARRSGEPTVADLREALVAEHGTDYGVRNPTWISRFGDTSRQAVSYRDRRVLLAGDAAHVHAPVSGQGLNLGVQDAMNLGWKLAQVVRGVSSEALLDSYGSERHPVAARVLRHTMAQGALLRQDERTRALRDITAELLSLYEPRQRVGAMISGLDIRYDVGSGHPLMGRRIPDVEVMTPEGPRRVFSLLHRARPVLLNLGGPGFDPSPWGHRVQVTDGEYHGEWELPVLGTVSAAKTILIRPDGYVAWAGNDTGAGLADAVTRWFGDR